MIIAQGRLSLQGGQLAIGIPGVADPGMMPLVVEIGNRDEVRSPGQQGAQAGHGDCDAVGVGVAGRQLLHHQCIRIGEQLLQPGPIVWLGQAFPGAADDLGVGNGRCQCQSQ